MPTLMQLRRIDASTTFLVTVERGEELTAVVRDACLQQEVTSAVLDGSGRASALTLEGGPAGSRRVGGPLELLHLHGTATQRGRKLELELRLVASREMDTGLEVVGGVLRDALVEAAMVRVSPHLPMGQTLADLKGSSWSAVAAASGEGPEPDEEEGEEAIPRPGDTVDHPKFGACVVRGIDDDHIRIRLEGGRTVSLGLSRVEFSLRGELSTGKRIFDVKIRRGDQR